MTRRSTQMPTPTMTCALVVLSAGSALAGDVTSTRLGGFPIDWSDAAKWDHDVPGIATFPNNGNLGHTYDVVVPNNIIDLDVPVTLDSLSGQYEIRLLGRTLTVLNEMSASFAQLSFGSIATGPMRATSTMILDGVTGTTGLITLDVNADLRLRGLTQLSAGGLRFTGDGDVFSDNGIAPSLDLSGKTITKVGGASVSDIQARIIASELTVSNEQPGTSIRFGQLDQAWGQLSVRARNSVVEFSKNLAVDDVDVRIDDESTEDGSIIILRGDVALAGRWTQAAPFINPLDPPRTVLTSSFGSGTLSGGVLDCSPDTPFTVREGGAVGTHGLVTNRGHVEFFSAAIEGGGYRNENTTTFLNGGGDMVIRDANLTNALLAQIFVNSPLRLSGNARVMNMSGTIFLGSVFPNEPGDELTSKLQNLTPSSLIKGRPAGGTVRVPFESVGVITTDGSPLRFEGTIQLAGRIEANTADTGAVVLSPEPWAQATPVVIGDLIVTGSGPVTEPTDALLIERGDTVITDKIRSSGGGPLFQVRLTGDATLSGGTLDVETPMRFLQDGGLVGTSAVTTNAGIFDLRAGRIDIPGVVNNGLLRITTPGSSDAVTIARLDNNSEVRHHQGVVHMEGDINNSGSWTAQTFTGQGTGSGLVRYPSGSGISAFTNTGTIGANDDATLEFDVFVDTPGTVLADGGTVRFSGPVQQFDPVTGTLSGGNWTTRNGGRIFFEDQQSGRVRSLEESTQVGVTDSTPAPDEPWAAIESVAGSLEVSGQSELDLTANDDFGDVEVGPSGLMRVDDVVLRLPSGQRGVSARIIANAITTRGVLAASGAGIVQASALIELLDGGTLAGQGGVFQAPAVLNSTGVVAPGEPGGAGRAGTGSIGLVTIDGDYTQGAGGALCVEIGAPAPGGSDRVTVTGAATLAGTLEVALVGGDVPGQGESFVVLDAGSITGAFGTIAADGFQIVHEAQAVRAVYIGACPADLAAPFGMLDFSDIVAFLTAFGAMGAGADLAPPAGVFDFSDVVTYLTAFGAGCP